ncbi:MAG: 50S ribosomal protein L25/general stress protein Ctc [Rickettsiales bacterium]|nr:50S ribosomal protein L25/general stress protein Ctc [Rickettsiales bacterium]
MSDSLLIQANLREKVGTGATRSLRGSGYVPAVVYGKGEETKLISISQKEAETLYNKSRIKTAMTKLKLADKDYNVFPKQFSLHPVTDSVEHVDFMFVNEKAKELRIRIPVSVKGKEKCPGIKKGGLLNIVFRSLPCKVVKDKVPSCIEIDVSKMDVGITLRLKDIILPEGVSLLIKDLNQTFLRLTGKRKVIEEAEIAAPGEEGEATDETTEAKGDEAKSAAPDTENKDKK